MELCWKSFTSRPCGTLNCKPDCKYDLLRFAVRGKSPVVAAVVVVSVAVAVVCGGGSIVININIIITK